MKGYRFYLEYETPADKRTGTVLAPGKHTGNVVATDLDTRHRGGFEGLSSVYAHADSPVNWGALPFDFLATRCRRIPETLARLIHPQLFARLDN